MQGGQKDLRSQFAYPMLVRMPWLFHLFLAIHIGAGIVALTSFWAAVATRKGGPRHRYFGRVFSASIYVASFQALGMGLLSVAWPTAMHTQLTDETLYRGLLGWMMIYLALLTMSMTRYGLQMIANKRNHDANRHWSMVALQLVVFVTGVNCFVQGIILRQPLMILVAILGFGTTMTYLWYIFKAARGPADYIPEHLKAMVATGIAAYTAFLSVGLIAHVPHLAFNPVIWAVPSVVGMGLIIHFLRRYPKRSPKAPETQNAF
jgi:uncharacterized membrane protein YhaH (DUF805 family)